MAEALRTGRLPLSFHRPRGLTLVELMVVVAIIAVLATILLPVIHSIREQGKGIVCMDHQRQLWQGFVLFAADHDGRLPGDLFDYPPPYLDGGDWLAAPAPRWGNGTTDSFDSAPQGGTLFKYVNHNYAIYRCPSLEAGDAPWYEGGGRGGSNGRWDYVAFSTFAGCHLHRVPNTCRFTDAATTLRLPTPIICEERAASINGNQMDGCHAEGDQLGHQHRRGSYYASPDGAVNWFDEATDASARNWFVVGPTGATCGMGLPLRSGDFERLGNFGF